MRRLFIAAIACAAFVLMTGVATAATQHGVGDGHHEGGADRALSTGGSSAKARFAPLGARLSGAATINGYLFTSYGSANAGATVEWDSWVASESKWYYSQAQTGSDGSFSFGNVVPTDAGEFWAYPDASTSFAFADSWSSGGTYNRVLYPGRVHAGATLGGPWADSFEYLAVRLWNSDSSQFTRSEVPANGTASPESLIDVLQGSYDRGSAKFYYDEGVEFSGSIVVPSGTQSSTGVWVDETNAQRVWVNSPYWASGKPGTTVKIVRNNYPAGWVNAVSGYSANPNLSTTWTYGNKTSSGAATQSLSVKVPAGATPGYEYWIGFQHVNGLGTLYLETQFQVCTLKATKTSVRRGAKIRVSGIVPIQGLWGDQDGVAKTVTLYAHKGTAPVPKKWNPKSQGWVKVGSVRTNARGAYKTPYFKPLKTLTLVVRYPGDQWYDDAYTSAQKITVR